MTVTADDVRSFVRSHHRGVLATTRRDGMPQAEGPATVESLPSAMDGLVRYYRVVAGEHPDWDEYRNAMDRDRRVLLRIRIELVGPNRSG